MLTAKPEVGDVITYTSQEGYRTVWKIVRVTGSDMYGDMLSSDVPSHPPTGEAWNNCKLGSWDSPGWSINFSQWVKTVRREDAGQRT